MRSLNIEELEDKIYEYSSDVEFIDKQHLHIKLNQFLNFLESQDISKRILERIEEDYKEINTNIPQDNVRNWSRNKQEFLETIKTPELQGALGYFLIKRTFNSSKIDYHSYLYIPRHWFDSSGDYDQMKDDFNTFLFKPFVDLLNFYISESQSRDDNDYFSKNEISEFEEKLNSLEIEINKLGFGQEIIFDEIQELKELLKSLKKKNWSEIFKGKLMELVIGEVISVKAMGFALKFITGDDINILNN